MRTNLLALAASVAAALLIAAPAAHAQARRPMFAAEHLDAVKRLTPEQRQERRFLQEAAARLRFQTEASRIALARSGNPSVRQLAATLLTYHRTVQPEMLHLLQQRGMAMPIVGNDEVRVLKALNRGSGAKFDRLFVDEVVLKANSADLVQYEKIATVTRDPRLRAWAERHVTDLRDHLALAERAQSPSGLAQARTRTMGAGAAMLSGASSP